MQLLYNYHYVGAFVIIYPQDHRDEYAALGFNVASVQLPTESTTILTTNQIIGIAVGGGLGILILVLLLITITW